MDWPFFGKKDKIQDMSIKAFLKEQNIPLVSKKDISLGFANDVYLINESFVLRVRKVEDTWSNSFEDEKWCKDQCLDANLAVPKTLHIGKIGKRDAELSTFMSGEILGGRQNEAAWQSDHYAHKMFFQMGQTLKRIHFIKTPAFMAFTERDTGFEDIYTYKSYILNRWAERIQKALTNIGYKPAEIEKIIGNLLLFYSRRKNVKSCLNHGDFFAEHILVKNEKITGILDWGEARADGYFFDLGRFNFFQQERKGKYLKSLLEGYGQMENMEENILFSELYISLEEAIWAYEQKNKQRLNYTKERLNLILKEI